MEITLTRALSATPPKISLTRRRILSAPTTNAQNMPPSADSAIKITLSRGDKLSPTRIYCAPQLAKIAPIIICPSTPIFHKPARKVTTKPMLTRVRGIQKLTTLPNLRESLKAPFQSASTTSSGSRPTALTSMAATASEIITGMSRKAIWVASVRGFFIDCPASLALQSHSQPSIAAS